MFNRRVIGWVVLATSTLFGVVGCDNKAGVGLVPAAKPLEVLSVNGVGPLNAATPFNLHGITAAFQGLNVTQQTNFSQGKSYPVITVNKDMKALLTINPDVQQQKVFSVMVHDNLIGNSLGHTIGMKFSDIYTYGHTEECGAGTEELSGKVLCYAPKTGNILYLFGGTWNGPDGAIPPQDVLAKWQMQAIIWKPPGK